MTHPRLVKIEVPEDAIVFVPTDVGNEHAWEWNIGLASSRIGYPMIARRHLARDLAEQQNPTLPTVGSVWETKLGRRWFARKSVTDGSIYLVPDVDPSEANGTTLTAGLFAAWLRDTGAKCVYSPDGKEAP